MNPATPLTPEDIVAFKGAAGNGFVYADLIIDLAKEDILTRLLLLTFLAQPAERGELLIAMGIRFGELRMQKEGAQ